MPRCRKAPKSVRGGYRYILQTGGDGDRVMRTRQNPAMWPAGALQFLPGSHGRRAACEVRLPRPVPGDLGCGRACLGTEGPVLVDCVEQVPSPLRTGISGCWRRQGPVRPARQRGGEPLLAHRGFRQRLADQAAAPHRYPADVNHRRRPEHQAEQPGNGHASGPPQAEQHQQQGKPRQNRVPRHGTGRRPGQARYLVPADPDPHQGPFPREPPPGTGLATGVPRGEASRAQRSLSRSTAAPVRRFTPRSGQALTGPMAPPQVRRSGGAGRVPIGRHWPRPAPWALAASRPRSTAVASTAATYATWSEGSVSQDIPASAALR